MGVKAVIIDISETLIDRENLPVKGTLNMIATLQSNGIQVFLVSNPRNGLRLDELYGLPAGSLLSSFSVGGKKGTGKFVEHVKAVLAISETEILYLGDGNTDMWEATNSNVFLLNAEWSQSPTRMQYGYPFPSPARAARGIVKWFGKEHPWYFSVDGEDGNARRYIYRSLLDPDESRITGVQDLLKRDIDIEPTTTNGKSIDKISKHLSGHLLASLYLDQRLQKDANSKQPIIALYPGHDGAQNPALSRLLNLGSKIFRTSFLPDLIIRHRPAIKSAFARHKNQVVDINNQLQTIHLNPEYRSKLNGKRVIVIDDFTTRGFGFETARNLLYNAGASEVISVSVGKYGARTNIFTLRSGIVFDSFAPLDLTDSDFEAVEVFGRIDRVALDHFRPSE